MRADKAFIDTNIFVYIQRTDELDKSRISEKTIDFLTVLSVPRF
jgi:predicted nucleic acid-binding protein